MAAEFILEAVTPERLVFEKPVEFVKLRTESGDIGILAKHINYITAIGAGEMLVREKDKEDVTYYLEGGFLEVRQDKVVILGVNIVETTKAEAEKMARQVAIEKAKNQKIKACHISVLYMTDKDLSGANLDKAVNSVLNEAESFLK